MTRQTARACIFDLDGTLLDSMGVWLDVDVAFLNKRGIDVPGDYADKISSMNFHEAADYTIGRFSLSDSADDLLREWRELANHAYGNAVRMKPGAKRYLRALKERGARLAIATSSFPEHCELALRAHGIREWFDAICYSSEVGRGKSSPDVFLLAARRLGAQPGECAVFEDILDAVKSAKGVGMAVCAVYDEAARGDWELMRALADWAIRDFRDAPAL